MSIEVTAARHTNCARCTRLAASTAQTRTCTPAARVSPHDSRTCPTPHPGGPSYRAILPPREEALPRAHAKRGEHVDGPAVCCPRAQHSLPGEEPKGPIIARSTPHTPGERHAGHLPTAPPARPDEAGRPARVSVHRAPLPVAKGKRGLGAVQRGRMEAARLWADQRANPLRRGHRQCLQGGEVIASSHTEGPVPEAHHDRARACRIAGVPRAHNKRTKVRPKRA